MAKKQKKDYSKLLKHISSEVKRIAKERKCDPGSLKKVDFFASAKGVTAWDISQLGGYSSIMQTMFNVPTRQNSAAYPKYKPNKLKNFAVHGNNMDDMFKEANLSKDGVFKIVVQPDTHVPQHDKRAISAFNKFLKDYKPHGYINIGDFLENDPSSHWDAKDAKPRRLVPEIIEARQVLDDTLKAAGPQCKFRRFLMGNHEDWTDQLLTSKIPEIYDGLEDLGVNLSIGGLLGLKDRNFKVIPINEILKVGGAHFIHGYYTSSHHAKKHLDVFGVNIYYGHLHDVQSHSGVSVEGLHESMSLGCLRSLNAAFLKGKPNNWSHAFGIFEFRIDGSFTRYVPIITEGEFTFNGKVYRGD
jgi:hypothetical protein